MNDLDRKNNLREWGIEVPLTNLEKEDWLREHGVLIMHTAPEGYYGDWMQGYNGEWNYGPGSHNIQERTREKVIDVLYAGAKDELYAWCGFHED